MTNTLLQPDTQTILHALVVLAQGMAGVFVFMGLFYLLIAALTAVFKPKIQP
ncbi:MAG: hypothetical protein GX294_08875 [Candidatus Cloacimonetes bacterium]|nr:hypothetical protein [Candidatus Cloacimonadota bacterium]